MSVEVGNASAAIAGQRAEGATRRTVALAQFFQDARLLLLGLWLGASLFFSFVVAPGVFAVLRDSTALYANHLAGSIVTRNLAVINTSGFFISLLLLVGAFLFRSKMRAPFLAEIVSLALIAITTGVGHWVIAAKMLALRRSMGRPIDETAAGDPARLAFNSLHGYSVTALTIAMLAALVAFILIARRRTQSSA
jgi:hypothetical protein